MRHLDWSQTSQIVVLLTEDHGKVRGLAKGAKRTSPSAVARYCGGIELLTRGQIVGTTKPTTELATLTEWDLQDSYFHLRSDLRAQQLAMYGCDIANALLGDHDPHPKVFTALAALLSALADRSQHETALLRYQWLLLDEGGYRPQLDRDVRSGEPLADRPTYTFDARSGGIIETSVQGTADSAAGPWRVRRATVEILRAVGDGRFDGAAGSVVVRRANRLMCVYLRAILDRPLATMSFVLDEPEDLSGGRLGT